MNGKLVRKVAGIGGVGALVALVLLRFAFPGVGIGAFVNFLSIQIGFALLAIGCIVALFRKWQSPLVLTLSGAALIWPVLAAGPSQDGAIAKPRADSALTLLWLNAQHSHKAVDRLFIANEGLTADVIAIAEMPANWRKRYAKELRDYPCIAWEDQNTSERIFIASRSSCALTPDLPAAQDFNNVNFVREAGGVTIVALHAPRPFDLDRLMRLDAPWNDAVLALRDKTITEAALIAAGGNGKGVLVGDFNAIGWSAPVSTLDIVGLRRTHCGPPWASTWIDAGTGLGVAIDHVLVAAEIDAICEIGPDLGSDHRPIIVRLQTKTALQPTASNGIADAR